MACELSCRRTAIRYSFSCSSYKSVLWCNYGRTTIDWLLIFQTFRCYAHTLRHVHVLGRCVSTRYGYIGCCIRGRYHTDRSGFRTGIPQPYSRDACAICERIVAGYEHSDGSWIYRCGNICPAHRTVGIVVFYISGIRLGSAGGNTYFLRTVRMAGQTKPN